MTKIAVIGAGLSGLSVAYLLKDHAEIVIYEKARGVGGRMSTREAEPYFFDHGAQYFTARTKPFQDFIQSFMDQAIIDRWNPRYVKLDAGQVVERKNWSDEEPRYVGVAGMNMVPKYIAKGLNVFINTRIVSLERYGKWQLTDDNGQSYNGFDWVICTAPSPQTVEVMPECFKYHADIKDINMRPCFSIMLGHEYSLPIEFEAALVVNSDVSWIAVNSHKPGRACDPTLVVHSSEEYAEVHIGDDRETVMQDLILEASRIIDHDLGSANYKTIHRWRYANNARIGKKNPIFIDCEHKLAACGDWCHGGRVEGAFASAYNLTLKMKEIAL